MMWAGTSLDAVSELGTMTDDKIMPVNGFLEWNAQEEADRDTP